jgi:predicted transcriptional regulator
VPVMPGGGVRAFGELEAAIMDQVWAAGRPVLVREIHDGLRPEREPAKAPGSAATIRRSSPGQYRAAG